MSDRRRFAGPESSRPISRLPRQKTSKRLDGRSDTQVRPIFIKTNLVTQANGSAYIETGNLKVVCAVYGPLPTRKDAPFSATAQLNVEVRYAPIASYSRRRTPGKETESLALSKQVEQALLPSLRLDLLPKSAIDLFLVILESDGPEEDISAGITASSLALAEAGIEMYGLVVGSCAAIKADPEKNDSVILMDPTEQEADDASCGLVSLASIPAMGTITNISVTGAISRQNLKQTLDRLNDASARIHRVAIQQSFV